MLPDWAGFGIPARLPGSDGWWYDVGQDLGAWKPSKGSTVTLERGPSLGGTHTLQRNLIQLFNFLYRERGNPSPYKEGLNRYAEVKGRPKTLAADFINTSGTTPTVRSTHRLPATTHSTA